MKKGRVGGQKMVAKEGKALPLLLVSFASCWKKKKEEEMKEKERKGEWLYKGGKYYYNVAIRMLWILWDLRLVTPCSLVYVSQYQYSIRRTKLI